MTTGPVPLRPLGARNAIGLILGAGFITGAGIAIGAYVHRAGFDGWAGFGIAVAAADLWFLIRAVLLPDPVRRGFPRRLAEVLAGLVALFGPVGLTVISFWVTFVKASHGWLILAGLLLIGVLLAIGVGGRRSAKQIRPK